jgi:predicted amidohydrolase YtcJ
MSVEKLFINARFGDGTRHSILVRGGRIIAITGEDHRPVASETIDLGGELLVPGFVEGHIHLDTSFYGDVWRPHKPCTNGFDVHERVAFQDAEPRRSRSDGCACKESTRSLYWAWHDTDAQSRDGRWHCRPQIS